jgi:DUF3050 family protein
MTRSFSPQARFVKLEKSLSPHVRKLMAHPLYGELHSLAEVRVLMESHVYAVWDFMSLVKALQIELTSVKVPWLPPLEPLLARFLNEIVLGEESDDLGHGLCLSHCALYLLAMADVGADASVFEEFLLRLRRGLPLRKALAGLPVPAHAKKFMIFTLETARQPVHRVAASFLYGRESVIPDMFRKIVAKVGGQKNSKLKALVLYLDRHIEVDGGSHGPLARRLLIHLCGESETRWVEAERTARRAIEERLALWDGVLKGIRDARRLV